VLIYATWEQDANVESQNHSQGLPGSLRCLARFHCQAAVRWYFRFQLSLRDIEELLFERGVTVT
jgi:hypothetical protein